MFGLALVLIVCANAWCYQPSQAVFLSAMCQSRCLEEHDEIPSCMKPCLDLKLHTLKNIKKCKNTCVLLDKATPLGTVACADSCSFLLKSLLSGKTLSDSCSKGKLCSVPASPVGLNVTDKNATLSMLRWSSPNQSWAVGTVFIITYRSRPSQYSLPGSWIQIGETTQSSLALTSLEERRLWYQFQVVAVNKFGASKPIQSEVVQLAVHRPNRPRDFKVSSMKVNSKGTVNVELSWKKPENLDVPVHRYRVYWSERLHRHEWSKEVISLRVDQARVLGTIHTFRVDELKANRTYVFELQAICLWRSQRLRSKRKYITVLTPFDSGQPATDFVQKTKWGPGTPVNNKVPIEDPSMQGKTAGRLNTTAGPPTGAPSRQSSTDKTSAKPRLVATLLLLVCYLLVQ